MRLVCISDTHSANPVLPEGDILVHAGDMSRHGRWSEIMEFDSWMAGLPHKHKIVIAGNHDIDLDRDAYETEPLLQSCTYLRDSGVEVEGLKFWGVPWTPDYFPENWGFNHPSPSEACQAVWDRVPEGIDVLISHGPPPGESETSLERVSEQAAR